MNKKKNCHCCDKIIALFENQLKELKSLVNSIFQSLQKPSTLMYSKIDQSNESLLLQDLEGLKNICSPTKRQIIVPKIGQQIATMEIKIKQIQSSIQILPKLKTHVSMLTKIVDYVQDKVQIIKKQNKQYQVNMQTRTQTNNKNMNGGKMFLSQEKKYNKNVQLFQQKF